MATHREKPAEIDAWQWDGSTAIDALPAWLRSAGITVTPDRELVIPTLSGTRYAAAGDWIVKDARGKVYPCKPHVFAATYELVS